MHARSLPGLAALLVAAAACGDLPTETDAFDGDPMFAAAGSHSVVASASGSGHAECAEESVNRCIAPGPLRTFSFNARVHADGTVGGTAQTHSRAGDGHRLKADITCVNFFGENDHRAWMIGTVTHSTNTDIPEGSVIGFAVADNGEGSGADADQITGFGISAPPITALICSGANGNLDFFFDNVFAFDAVAGNIQVQPPEAG